MTMRKLVYYRAVCCTCPALGPADKTSRWAARLARAKGWHRCLGLWQCPRCQEEGRLPEVEVVTTEASSGPSHHVVVIAE